MEHKNMTAKYISIKTAAERYDLSPLTVRDWVNKGKWPSCKINGARRIPVSFLEKMERESMTSQEIVRSK